MIPPYEIALCSLLVHAIAISEPRVTLGMQQSSTCIPCLRELGWSWDQTWRQVKSRA